MSKYSIQILIFFPWLVGCAISPVKREVISTPEAPAAIGPYSQGIKTGNTIYLSGQIAMDPATGKLVEGGIEAQAHQVLKNIRVVLRAAGFTMEDVVQVQVFLSNLDDYGTLNTIYSEYFKTSPPARAVVQVAKLPRNALVEVMVTAVRSGK